MHCVGISLFYSLPCGSLVNSMMSLGVHSNILHNFSNVAVVMCLLCFKLQIVFDNTLYFPINVYVVISFCFIVFHKGSQDTILYPPSKPLFYVYKRDMDISIIIGIIEICTLTKKHPAASLPLDREIYPVSSFNWHAADQISAENHVLAYTFS